MDNQKFYREIPPLTKGDSFLVFDRLKRYI